MVMKDKSDNRWYDSNPDLKTFLHLLKTSSETNQEKIFNSIKDIIMEYDDNLVEKHVMEFPLTEKRRWYDKDPYSWLAINSLRYLDSNAIKKVIDLKKDL
jgi:hypothetical protein